MRKSKLEDTVGQLTEPVASELDLELVDVEFVREGDNWYLRVYIDKEGGVGLDDCERMSRALDAILDEADPIPQSYYLEVSSPGVERPLRKLTDFQRFAGSKALVKTYGPIDGRRKFEGILGGVEGDAILVDVGNGEHVRIPMEAVSKANLVYEW